MDVLFGDTAAAEPTPTTQGERGSLIGGDSPVSSLDIRRQYGQLGQDSAIPNLDVNQPKSDGDGNVKSGGSEGIGGWISNMVGRQKGSSKQKGHYRALDQEDDEH